MQPTTPSVSASKAHCRAGRLVCHDLWLLFGKYWSEASLGMALKEVGAQFTLFYDSLAPRKPTPASVSLRCANGCKCLPVNNTYAISMVPGCRAPGRASLQRRNNWISYRQRFVLRGSLG